MGPDRTGRVSELGGSSRRRHTPMELGEELVAVSRGVVEDRWRVALVVVLVLAGLTLPAGVASAQFPGNYTMVVDQGGPNDVNSSQVDLTQFGRDDSDPNRYKLLWSWDATDDWTGTGRRAMRARCLTATATAGSTSPSARDPESGREPERGDAGGGLAVCVHVQ